MRPSGWTVLCTASGTKKNNDMHMIRLDKYLSSQLGLSRSDVKTLIRQKSVSVIGVPACRPELQIDADKAQVFVDGKQILYKRFLYIMQNKPQGIVSASADDACKTVIDILPDALRRNGLFPAGRLDKDTAGFVFITDDGQFAHDILSPAHHVEKEYSVTLSRTVLPEEAEAIRNGLTVGEEHFKPAKLYPVRADGNEAVFNIVLTEGRYHQIKRMFGHFGNPVAALHRIRIGGVMLDASLAPGESRELTENELALLCKNTN